MKALESNRDYYILRVIKSVLEKTSGFDKEECSSTRDELANVYMHYGLRAYWENK